MLNLLLFYCWSYNIDKFWCLNISPVLCHIFRCRKSSGRDSVTLVLLGNSLGWSSSTGGSASSGIFNLIAVKLSGEVRIFCFSVLLNDKGSNDFQPGAPKIICLRFWEFCQALSSGFRVLSFMEHFAFWDWKILSVHVLRLCAWQSKKLNSLAVVLYFSFRFSPVRWCAVLKVNFKISVPTSCLLK